jgi:opacity protein-like surface antigen
MKNFLMLAVLALATIEASAQTSQPTTPMTKAERKAARAAKQPQVYKGTVAERRRMVTDAPGAEGDRDGDDDATTTKSGKKSKSKN